MTKTERQMIASILAAQRVPATPTELAIWERRAARIAARKPIEQEPAELIAEFNGRDSLIMPEWKSRIIRLSE